ncbi:hypothetical protein [Streptomyces sp. NPDC005262]|uniref:hypothetical protein n=1 Tax=Streptomyces sp. NPDC005262 TaxID=3364710 RepID=UPI0036A32793
MTAKNLDQRAGAAPLAMGVGCRRPPGVVKRWREEDSHEERHQKAEQDQFVPQ